MAILVLYFQIFGGKFKIHKSVKYYTAKMGHIHSFGAYYSILWVQKRLPGQVEVSPEANFDFIGEQI